MIELSSKLENAFKEFFIMQSEMEILLTEHPENFPSCMDRWIAEYRRVAATLTFLLDTYRENLVDGYDMIEAAKWQTMLSVAIEKQNNLYRLLENVRDEMAIRLEDMKAGKAAISGYHSGTGVDIPVFISRNA